MLQPKKEKFRKQFRGKMRGIATSGTRVSFGDYGLKALACTWLKANQIEAARRAITHHTKRAGKVWIRIFPDKPYTKKGQGVGMGAGKGDVHGHVAVIRPGKMLFEIAGVSENLAREAFRLAAAKLPIKTKFVVKS